ncbi:glutamate 5-kinase [Caldalkalibacillus mannanilyticus]|uniref:glutamate 5-kinase n=1 Tax=Caldalkalibacillus mannanilyticus TaxID=1418 RepID=UPI000469B041|nr:glutamate 5-kinase [Caldalkalibacillus mannanilyticus]
MSRKRVVIKFGSSSLTTEDGQIDHQRIAFYVDNIHEMIKAGYTPVIVSSGAVAAGYSQMGYKKRPTILAQKQAAAAVGQGILMQIYNEIFAKYDLVVSQLLLTRMDLTDRERCHNAYNTLEELLQHGVIPIINENDSVSVNELKFGDNDLLSSYVANLVKASHLFIVTDMNGLYTDDPRKNPNAKRIDIVETISNEIVEIAGGAGSSVGTGGMKTKVEAARVGLFGGISVYIGKLTPESRIIDMMKGTGDGTYFLPSASPLSMKKQWLGLHSMVRGEIMIDAGASQALIHQGKSLLPAGVLDVQGEFHQGDVVEVKDEKGRTLGRGISNYNAWQIRAVKGLSSQEVAERTEVDKIEVIHRDEWVAYTMSGEDRV